MSEESGEIVRAAFDAWNRDDRDAWLATWDEEAEFYPLRAQLEGRAYHGHDGLRRFIAEMDEDWEEVRFEIDEIRDTGAAGGVRPLPGTGSGERCRAGCPAWLGRGRAEQEDRLLALLLGPG